jgi:hypothetical protein
MSGHRWDFRKLNRSFKRRDRRNNPINVLNKRPAFQLAGISRDTLSNKLSADNFLNPATRPALIEKILTVGFVTLIRSTVFFVTIHRG